MKKDQNPKRKMTSRQIAAIIGIAALIFLYAASLIAAILDSSVSAAWFRASLFGTVALPLLIWIYVWLYGKFTGKHTFADSPEKTDFQNDTTEQNVLSKDISMRNAAPNTCSQDMIPDNDSGQITGSETVQNIGKIS